MRAGMLMIISATSLLAQEGDGVGKEVDRQQSRSMVMYKCGIVATSQTLASAVGVKVLEAGGNAIDAAVAANATRGLVEPTGNGMGGDLFAIVYEAKTGKYYGLNSSGWSASGMTVEFLKSKGITKMPMQGIYSATVGGAVAGWDALHKKFGKLAWQQLFEPAIRYAEDGYAVTELISQRWHLEEAKLKSPEAARIWLPGGKAPVAGQWFRNPTLAKSLRMVSKEGRDGLYRGPIAESIVAVSKSLGGTFSLADLADFQPEWVEPISTEDRGWKVMDLPPNGMGIAALGMLNIMERFPLASYGHNSAQALHVMIEAKKLAYADMLRYTGDMRFAKVPGSEMTSKNLGVKHAGEINPERASCKVTPAELISMSKMPGADTIY